MPTEERFRHAPCGAYVERHPLSESSTFRYGQQPKLRKIGFGSGHIELFLTVRNSTARLKQGIVERQLNAP